MKNRALFQVPIYRHICALASTIAFILLHFWSSRHITGYFLEWLSRQTFWCAWIISIVLIYMGQWLAGLLLAVSHWVGIPFAISVGDRLYMQAQALLTNNPTAEQLHQAEPKHAFLWWEAIAVLTILGFLAQYLLKRVLKDRQKK